jgi:hypothetical protein
MAIVRCNGNRRGEYERVRRVLDLSPASPKVERHKMPTRHRCTDQGIRLLMIDVTGHVLDDAALVYRLHPHTSPSPDMIRADSSASGFGRRGVRKHRGFCLFVLPCVRCSPVLLACMCFVCACGLLAAMPGILICFDPHVLHALTMPALGSLCSTFVSPLAGPLGTRS